METGELEINNTRRKERNKRAVKTSKTSTTLIRTSGSKQLYININDFNDLKQGNKVFNPKVKVRKALAAKQIEHLVISKTDH